MNLVDRILQLFRRTEKGIVPVISSNKNFTQIKRVDDKIVENLLLYTSIEYSHYRGKFESSMSRKDIINWLGINYSKNSSNIYQVSVHIDPFILQKDGLYYPFKGTDIQAPLRFRNGQVQIVEHAKIKNPPYDHPFVYTNGDICYGNLNWSKDKGVIFNHYYDMNGMRSIARKIAYVLTEGRRNIEKGYLGKRLNPVNDIEKYKSVANNRNEAESFAKRNNISLDRIISNDG